MRRNLAAVEGDLALRRAPAVAHPASAAAVRRASKTGRTTPFFAHPEASFQFRELILSVPAVRIVVP
jgi:hypothetical protein